MLSKKLIKVFKIIKNKIIKDHVPSVVEQGGGLDKFDQKELKAKKASYGLRYYLAKVFLGNEQWALPNDMTDLRNTKLKWQQHRAGELT